MQAALAWAILTELGWRWLVALSSLPLLCLLLLYPLLPESPYWLVAAGRTADAQALLHSIARANGRLLPVGRLQPSATATKVSTLCFVVSLGGGKPLFLYRVIVIAGSWELRENPNQHAMPHACDGRANGQPPPLDQGPQLRLAWWCPIGFQDIRMAAVLVCNVNCTGGFWPLDIPLFVLAQSPSLKSGSVPMVVAVKCQGC